jgi:hypothetical protein
MTIRELRDIVNTDFAALGYPFLTDDETITILLPSQRPPGNVATEFVFHWHHSKGFVFDCQAVEVPKEAR